MPDRLDTRALDELREALRNRFVLAVQRRCSGISYEDVQLAFMTRLDEWAMLNHQPNGPAELLAPTLDVLARAALPVATTVSHTALQAASHWVLTASLKYAECLGDIAHARDGELQAHRTGGVISFEPVNRAAVERHEYVEWLWRQQLTSAAVPFRDAVDAAAHAIAGRSIERARPDWKDRKYRNACSAFAVAILRAHLAVADGEAWGDLSLTQVESALLPLLTRAVHRFYLVRAGHESAPEARREKLERMQIAVEAEESLLDEVRACAGAGDAVSRRFVERLILQVPNDNVRPWGRPLVRLSHGRIAYLPQMMINGAWLMKWERDESPRNRPEFKQARDGRLTREIEVALGALDLGDIASKVVIGNGRGNPGDMDVVVLAPDGAAALAVELKGFTTGTGLTSQAVDAHMRKAKDEQCPGVVAQYPEVKVALAQRFRRAVREDVRLFQIIVTEGNVGLSGDGEEYPVVTVPWLHSLKASGQSPGTIQALWEQARYLPDASAFRVARAWVTQDTGFPPDEADQLQFQSWLWVTR